MNELHMITDLLPEPEPPSAAATQAGYARLVAAQSAASRRTGRRQGWSYWRRRRPVAARGRRAGLAAVAAGVCALAVFVATAGPGSRPNLAVHAGHQPTAREILLAAARNVVHSQPVASYWRLLETDYWTVAAGTRAHPYNILAGKRGDNWVPLRPGKPDVSVVQTVVSRPATAADAAAWRAAGSPTHWVFTQGSVTGVVSATTAGRAFIYPQRRASDSICPIAVGYLRPASLTLARCLRLPATAAGLKTVLLGLADAVIRARHGTTRQPTAEQMVAEGAFSLLTDPVRPRTDAAALRLIAAYPGAREVGKVRDPMGRRGYGIMIPGLLTSAVFVIDPSSGRLLAVNDVYNKSGRVLWKAQREPGFFGRPWYRGLVEAWFVYRSIGWTNASPPRR